MFIKIIRTSNDCITVWIMKDAASGVRIYFFDDLNEARESIKDLLAVLKDFPVVCLQETKITNQTDLELILM